MSRLRCRPKASSRVPARRVRSISMKTIAKRSSVQEAVSRRLSVLSVLSAARIATALLGATPHALQQPPVMGRNAGVSAGHPLTTPPRSKCSRRAATRSTPASPRCWSAASSSRISTASAAKALVLVYPRSEAQGHVDRRAGLGAEGRHDRLVHARGKDLDGAGLDPAVVPGALHAALTVLERWGTMSFEQVSARAIEYAERGFPLRPRTAQAIEGNLKFFESWPDNQRYWLKPDGSLYKAGETIKLPDARAHADADGRGRASRGEERPRGRHRRRARSILQGRHRARDGRVSQDSIRRRSSSTTSPSTSRGSKSRRRRTIAATRSTSTRSAARVRCCSRRSTSWSSSI